MKTYNTIREGKEDLGTEFDYGSRCYSNIGLCLQVKSLEQLAFKPAIVICTQSKQNGPVLVVQKLVKKTFALTGFVLGYQIEFTIVKQ